MSPTVHRLVIRGLVQGVGFRWSLAQEAERLRVRGWVRNRRDGSVEALVAGTPQAVQRIIDWARRGPPSATVMQVEVLPGSEAEGGLEGFEQRPTA